MKQYFSYLEIPNRMYQGNLTVEKRDDNEYLSIFSVVFQDFRLFSFSLGQNVATGSVYDEERAGECLRRARLGERLVSCRFCNKIAVFDRGEIVQAGSHETLLAEAQGKYTALWNARAQYYEPSG